MKPTNKSESTHIINRHREHSAILRDKIMSIRVNKREYETLVKAATLRGESLGAFIMSVTMPKAERLIKE